jgi:4-alpha-glucanotransferase
VDRELLESRGIEPEYYDIWGQKHVTSDETAAAILTSLGEPAGDSTIVVRENADSIHVRIPHVGAVTLEIEWEDGGLESHEVDAGERIPLPKLRLGYHRLRLRSKQEVFADVRFIVCPLRALPVTERMAGVALSLYGLRSSRNWGVGDFTDLRAAIDVFAEAGVDFIALNPLHSIPNRQPYNTSPYLPQSSLYRNFIYLDVEALGAVAPPEVEQLRASEFVNYEAVAALKLSAMRELFARFQGSPEFDRYVESEGELLQTFAVYCALDEEMHRRDPDVWLWTDWPVEFRCPRGKAAVDFPVAHGEIVVFFKFLQWHVDQQLSEAQAHAISKGMRIGLYHDLALATDRFGADLWANREFYATGARVGAPPDDFSPKGQDWSFPPPNRDVHRADGYELFTQSIRKNARHGGALRIDHVMRFFRLYWIPDGADATTGAYVRDYSDDLLGILVLESVRGNFVVIGEDLGTVTDEVRVKLSETGVLSYRVLWFSKHGDGSFMRPEEYAEHAAVSTTTHDLPTLAGFAAGRDIEVRLDAGLIDEAQYQQRVAERGHEIAKLTEALRSAGFDDDPIGFLLSTPCLLAIVNQEDLTSEVDQQNLPGTTSEHPNWKRKMKVAIEDLGPLAQTLRDKIIFSKRGTEAPKQC